MKKTFVQQVAENIRDTLERIKTIGGYEVTLYAADLAQTPHNERRHLAAAVAIGEHEELVATHSHRVIAQTYYISITAVEPEASAANDYQLLQANIYADVYKALMVDTHRNGLANQTVVGQMDAEDNAVQITVVCDIEHDHGDPYTRT